METQDIERALKSLETGMVNEQQGWSNYTSSKLDRLKALESKKSQIAEDIASTMSEIEELNAALAEIQAQKRFKLENEGISQKVKSLRREIALLEATRTSRLVLPECPVCLEVCDPGQGRFVFCCPEGHSVCGVCAANVDRCPICRRTKASFGGTFTRNRELERLAGVRIALPDDQVDVGRKIALLTLQLQPIERQKGQIEQLFFDKKVSPLQKRSDAHNRLKEAKQALQNVEYAIEGERSLLNDFLKKGEALLEHMQGLPRYLAALKCRCSLACPHHLQIDLDGKVCEQLCTCVQTTKKACLCITHSVTFDVEIEGGSKGPIKIYLAGRSHPRGVNRFYSLAVGNLYVDTIISYIDKDNCVYVGFRHMDNTEFNPIDKLDAKVDSTVRTLLPAGKYSVGVHEGQDGHRPGFVIYTGGEDSKSSPYFRTIGRIANGHNLVDEINSVPIKVNAKVKNKLLKKMPDQTVLIKRSTGEVVLDDGPLQLYSLM